MKSILIVGASNAGKSTTAYEICSQLKPNKVYRLNITNETLIESDLKAIFNNTFIIEVNGKSSLARIGLIVHNSASIVNPGHYLNIALELCNLNNVPIVLRPGMEIAQLSFSTLSSHTRKSYKETGRYHLNNIVGYVPPKTGPLARKTLKKVTKAKRT